MRQPLWNLLIVVPLTVGRTMIASGSRSGPSKVAALSAGAASVARASQEWLRENGFSCSLSPLAPPFSSPQARPASSLLEIPLEPPLLADVPTASNVFSPPWASSPGSGDARNPKTGASKRQTTWLPTCPSPVGIALDRLVCTATSFLIKQQEEQQEPDPAQTPWRPAHAVHRPFPHSSHVAPHRLRAASWASSLTGRLRWSANTRQNLETRFRALPGSTLASEPLPGSAGSAGKRRKRELHKQFLVQAPISAGSINDTAVKAQEKPPTSKTRWSRPRTRQFH